MTGGMISREGTIRGNEIIIRPSELSYVDPANIATGVDISATATDVNRIDSRVQAMRQNRFIGIRPQNADPLTGPDPDA